MSHLETADALGRVEMSPSLRDSLQRAISHAYEQRHRRVSLEHLLLALVDDREAAIILEASAIDVRALVADVSAYLGGLQDRVTEGERREPALGDDVQHIMRSAGAAAEKSNRRAVGSALVLAAVVGDGRSPSAQILRHRGLTFEHAIAALKQANAAAAARPVAPSAGRASGNSAEPPARRPSAQGLPAAASPSVNAVAANGQPTGVSPPPAAIAAGATRQSASPTSKPTPSLAGARLQNVQAAHDIIAGARERIAAARGVIAARSQEQSAAADLNETGQAAKTLHDSAPSPLPNGTSAPMPQVPEKRPAAEPQVPEPTTEAEAASPQVARANGANGQATSLPVQAEPSSKAAMADKTLEIDTSMPPDPPTIAVASSHDRRATSESAKPVAEAKSTASQAPASSEQELRPTSPATPSVHHPTKPAVPPPAASAPPLVAIRDDEPSQQPLPQRHQPPPTQPSATPAPSEPGSPQASQHQLQVPPADPRLQVTTSPSQRPQRLAQPVVSMPSAQAPAEPESLSSGPVTAGSTGQPAPSMPRQPSTPQQHPSRPAASGPPAAPRPTPSARPTFQAPVSSAPALRSPSQLPTSTIGAVPRPAPQGPTPNPVRSPDRQTAQPTAARAIRPDYTDHLTPDLPPSPTPLPASNARPIEPEALAASIPNRMRVGKPTTVEIRAPRAQLEAWSGSADPSVHQQIIAKAMAMRLKAPDGGFTIEIASPETQWSEGHMGPLSDDVVSWRWIVTPTARGRRPLQLNVSTRVVGRDGLAAARKLPEQDVTVRVRPNYSRAIGQTVVWLVLAAAFVGVGYFGESLFNMGQSMLAQVIR